MYVAIETKLAIDNFSKMFSRFSLREDMFAEIIVNVNIV